MNITIHQPNFFPRLKILQKLASSDLWVVMDNVQFSKHEWQNRTKLIPMNGNHQEFWLTVPVICPDGKHTFIKDVVNSSNTLSNNFRKAFQCAFRKSPYWNEVEEILESIYPILELGDLTMIDVGITVELLRLTGKVPEIIYSSQLPVTGKKSALVAAICRYLKADTYLCDSGGKRYLDVNEFKDIKVVWQKWEEPLSTCTDVNSWRDISCINYLAREGKERFVEHITADDFREESDFY